MLVECLYSMTLLPGGAAAEWATYEWSAAEKEKEKVKVKEHEEESTAAGEAAAAVAAAAAARGGGPFRVLLAEDSRSNQMAISQLIKAQGVDVAVAGAYTRPLLRST
jgi:CheY-like chemotaxis protein